MALETPTLEQSLVWQVPHSNSADAARPMQDPANVAVLNTAADRADEAGQAQAPEIGGGPSAPAPISGGLTGASAQPAAPAAQPAAPATPLHSKIAEGIIHAFAGTDGTAGSALRSALAGGLAGLAAASNRPAGNVPRGAAALGGFGAGATAAIQQSQQQQQQALENKQKQATLDQQATREKYLNAETQARTYADQITANNASQEGLQKRYQAAGHLADAFSTDHTLVGDGVTEPELIAEGGPGGKYDHTKVTGFNTGEKEVMQDGKMVTLPTFKVFNNEPDKARQVEISEGVSKVLAEAGFNYPAGTKMDSKLLDSMGTKAMSSMTTRSLMEEAAAKEGLAEDQVKAAASHGADMATINPTIGAYMAKHPLDFFGALDFAAQQKGAVGDAGTRIRNSYDPKDLDKIRHERVEEQQKGEELQIKKAAGDPAAWNLNGPSGAPTPLQGAGYLKSLPQPMAAALTEAAEGRGNPVMMQNRKGELTPMGEAMMKAYPDYDIGKAKEYPKLVSEFVTGQTSKDLVAMGTAINHTRAAYDNTGPDSYVPGTKENNRYNQDVGYVSEELGKYVKGGVATGGEVDKILDGIKSRNPAVRKSALENAATIIEGRRTELQQKWQNGQVRPSYQPPMPSISPTAEANFAYLKSGGNPAALQKPAPVSHDFNPTTWATANPGKDVNAAIAAAKAKGYNVVNQ